MLIDGAGDVGKRVDRAADEWAMVVAWGGAVSSCGWDEQDLHLGFVVGGDGFSEGAGAGD
jgi:hypothetical protein